MARQQGEVIKERRRKAADVCAIKPPDLVWQTAKKFSSEIEKLIFK
jgi:hypothetical protein